MARLAFLEDAAAVFDVAVVGRDRGGDQLDWWYGGGGTVG